ncbi:MAG TPA: phosphoribosylformylglycinamidine synthase [Clostridiales bacterium]|nr:phosphoribosylformylglycinamidine synthase [Clostridiales bacterium]
MGNMKRIYVKKKQGFDVEAQMLLRELSTLLNIKGLEGLAIINRYDVENIEEQVFQEAIETFFSEPATDHVFYDIKPEIEKAARFLPVEYLPGQYDQREDMASQSLKLLTLKGTPIVKTAKVYLFYGEISEEQFRKLKTHIINPLDARMASMELPVTLADNPPAPKKVDVVTGFISMTPEQTMEYLTENSLAMSLEDLLFVQAYFRDTEKRDPFITEVKVLDTYWSDHCRHTTFNTTIESVAFDQGTVSERIKETYEKYQGIRNVVYKEKKKDICLMDIATLGMKYLRQNGLLEDLDASEEINACSIKIQANVNGEKQDWLVMFKNETHNHPTEFEPFGGASTCLGGAIRDPLSGRSYVYQAMRITGSGDPLHKVEDTLPGKLPQFKITTTAAKGYSSYGNQIGISSGYLNEIYHPGFMAKRMELGAVISAAPAENVRREKPVKGDVVILVGGHTGRDGLGGATGSSKEHDEGSFTTAGAEVQKGNPLIERNIQRLFRDKKVSCLIKRCNDFGAGGVSVAIGELAEGLDIYLDYVPTKYEGLDGTELAISESQERMAVVVAGKDADTFIKAADMENLEAVVVADVTDTNRMRMFWRDQIIVDISRDFIETNGMGQKTSIHVTEPVGESYFKVKELKFNQVREVLSSLNVCSKKGLAEMFDSTAGASTVLFPLGGKYQLTPQEGMAAKLPVLDGDTDTCTVMSYGYDPYIGEWSPYHGAAYAVTESLAKIAALGCDWRKTRLSFQEYFEKLSRDPARWGKPFSALLGAFEAQTALGIPSIGGKDSMSGTFKDINVPPTLVSFAVCVTEGDRIRSSELKEAGNTLYLLKVKKDKDMIPDYEALAQIWDFVSSVQQKDGLVSASVVKGVGVIETIFRTAFGNRLGVHLEDSLTEEQLFMPDMGSLLIEVDSRFKGFPEKLEPIKIGYITTQPVVQYKDSIITLEEAQQAWEGTLEPIFPTRKKNAVANSVLTDKGYTMRRGRAVTKIAKPNVFIPIFPGTNGEYESKKAFETAGASVYDFVFRNLTGNDIQKSIDEMVKVIKKCQIIMIPGGASAGDEPDGAGKYIAAILKNPFIEEALNDLLYNRDGLILGICNGFQGLIKSGLLPYGKITRMNDGAPVLAKNTCGRYVSHMVQTKVLSVLSPWFIKSELGDTHTTVFSSSEGRFVASEKELLEMAKAGQIATGYVDCSGNVTEDVRFNPSGSVGGVEGITSPDGRILGKMTHSERKGKYVGINVPGNKDQLIFESGVAYFK